MHRSHPRDLLVLVRVLLLIGIGLAAGASLPDELWDELESLTPGPEHWLDHA